MFGRKTVGCEISPFTKNCPSRRLCRLGKILPARRFSSEDLPAPEGPRMEVKVEALALPDTSLRIAFPLIVNEILRQAKLAS